MGIRMLVLVFVFFGMVEVGFAQCEYFQDVYGNAVFTRGCLDLGEEEFKATVGGMRDEFMSAPESKYLGMIFKVPHEAYGYNPSALLKQLGFEAYGVNDREQIWVIRGGSSMPDFATAIAGSKVLLMRKGSLDEEQILLVREKYVRKPVWQLPGGAVNRFELIEEAGKRELLEEVGLRGKFVRMLMLINRSKVLGDMSDYCFYSLYHLAEGENGDVLRLQENEITQARWFDINTVMMHGSDRELEGHLVHSKIIQALKIYLKVEREHRVEVMAPGSDIECQDERCEAVKKVRNYYFFQYPVPYNDDIY